MKFNYSGQQIKAGLRDVALSSYHPVTSLLAITKNYVRLEHDLGQRNYLRELTIANKMLAFQNKEKEKRAAELAIANKMLAFQNKEKEKRAAELVVANKELAFQSIEKENRAAELIIANKELVFQNEEKEKRAAELIIANKELAFQNEEKENRAAELIIANNELVFQNIEKENRAAELNSAYKELEKADEYLRGYIQGLEEMMFITSHKVRQPVCNILGIVSILDQFISSPAQFKKMVKYLKVSALSLDSFTKELTNFIFNLEQKGKDEGLPLV